MGRDEPVYPGDAAIQGRMILPSNASERVLYAARRLQAALPDDGRVIRFVGIEQSACPEGFEIRTESDGSIMIAGSDSGLLYGVLALCDLIRTQGRIPDQIHFSDAPNWVLRGPCIGMQKTYYLPGRKVYEYPYTPDLFPFFYDKVHWTEYLDRLVDWRFNTLYLWSGHPFASLVRVKGYEYAVEVTPEIFDKNVEMFHWLASECDRRGIWLVQNFYSIILPKPFAERHGCDTQLSAPTPEARDYMRKCIAEFVVQFPRVGLMICLGEALQGLENQILWCCDVCLGGIHDGMKRAGITVEPPVVLRTHATDAKKVVPEALKVHKNLYTEAKYNGESLTTWEPRGVRQNVHLSMSQLGSTHLINVHILANLEPFRYGAQRFIKKCVRAAIDRLGAKGIHLYPLAYWNWPDSPDVAIPPLRQIDRDWMWFESWARYAWNPHIDEDEDRAYWVRKLADLYGSTKAAEHILDALNDIGECAPRLLRRFGITEGNRQTMSLGMLLDQLVNPAKYRPFEELWESQSPPGERLQEFVEKEVQNLPHEGETPPQICEEVLQFAQRASESIARARSYVTQNQPEFERIANDIACITAMSRNYVAKVRAAIGVLRYSHTRDLQDMIEAEQHLHESFEYFRELTRLTETTYHFANTMQTEQRRIPVPGGLGDKRDNYHWRHLLPIYEAELREFRDRVERLKRGEPEGPDESHIKPFRKSKIRLISPHAEVYDVRPGAKVFTDRGYTIRSIAPELVGLTGIRFSQDQAKSGTLPLIEFESPEPVLALIGYFKSPKPIWRRPPDLELDAMASHRGGCEPCIDNAATIDGCPSLDIHALRYDAGRQTLDLRGSGSFLVLGFVPQSTVLTRRDAMRSGNIE
jgi:hypothetical protein